MSARNNNFKLGVFVLVALAVLVGSLLALGARDRFRPKIRFETAITGDVEGLSVGSVVKFRGVQIGNVTGIQFAWSAYPGTTNNYVVVRFEADAEVLPLDDRLLGEQALRESINEGLRTRLKMQAITGSSTLVLETLDPERFPPPAIDWQPGQLYIPSAPSLLGEMLDLIAESLYNLQQLDVASLQQSVDQVLDSLDTLVKNVNKVDFEAVGNAGRDRLVELKLTNEKLQLLLDDARSAVGGMDLAALSGSATQLIKDVQETVQRLQTVVDGLRNLDLAAANETLVRTRRAMGELERLLHDVRAYPAGALWGEPPPPARSVEKP